MENILEQYNLYPEGGYDDPCRDEELDYVDDRFLKLEALIKAYGSNPDKSPLSSENARFLALWLHRWIMHERHVRRINKLVEMGILAYVYGAYTPRETRNLQRKASHDIGVAARLLTQRLAATSFFTNLGPILEDAYNAITQETEECPDEDKHIEVRDFMDRFNKPTWESVQANIFAYLILINEVAIKASKDLSPANAKMGQPPKTKRDALFFQWQERIASDLSMSLDDSLHFASKSWGIYFPDEDIKVDAAEKIIKTQRARAKGK